MSQYNTQPNGWTEITADLFAHYFFTYIFKPSESRQMHRDENGDKVDYKGTAKLFEVRYPDWEGMGVAMRWEFEIDFDKGRMAYYRYGEDDRWIERTRKFAAQFAGDNS